MTKSYNDEDFLEVAFGNFLDSIKNLVYGLQKYINMLHYTGDSIYLEYGTIKNQELKDIAKFVMLESEEIIKMKAIKFSIDAETLLRKKYESLVENINHEKNDYRYRISAEAYIYLDEFQKETNWDTIVSKCYKMLSKGNKNSYDFIHHMKDEFKQYESLKFKPTKNTIDKKELITILDGAFMNLSVSMLKFKRMIEGSTSIYVSASICKKIITLLIVTYVVISTIKIEK